MQKTNTTKTAISLSGTIRFRTFVFAMVMSSIVFSTTTVAAPAGATQLASISATQLRADKEITGNMKFKDDDNEIGSTFLLRLNADVGGYNREDGSMQGAYGDGDFGE